MLLRLYFNSVLQRIVVLAIALFLVFVVPVLALAQASGTVVNAGAVMADFRAVIEWVFGGMIAVVLTAICLLLHKYLGINIDATSRAQLQAVLEQGAHSALDRAQDHADTVSLDLRSAAVVHLVDYARLLAPKPVKQLRLDDDRLEEMARAQILKALPVLGTVADPALTPPAAA